MKVKEKELIADYMELIFNPARMSLYSYKDGREFKFNSNDASFCAQEMQNRGDWEKFKGFAVDYFPYTIDTSTINSIDGLGRELSNMYSQFIAWIFNDENFFNAMIAWLRKGK